MGVKRSLSPLTEIPGLTQHQLDALGAINVSTSEELLGMVKSDPQRTQSFLKLKSTDMAKLEAQLKDSLDPAMRAAFEEDSEHEIAYGARIPSERERTD